jgi:lambda repressor-like predicted transcriptional regulator
MNSLSNDPIEIESLPNDPIEIEFELRRRGLSFASVGRDNNLSRSVVSNCVHHGDKVRKALKKALKNPIKAKQL